MKGWRGTETGEAPRGQGATTENTGEYLREEQRSPRGSIARRMQSDFHHGLLGRRAPRTAAARIGSGNAEVSNSRRSAREKARNLEKLADLLTDDTRMPEPIIV